MHFIGAARWCHLVIEQLRAAPPPCYQAKVTCCRTIRGLAQPLVAAAVGPAHKLPAVSERIQSVLVDWWSSGGE